VPARIRKKWTAEERAKYELEESRAKPPVDYSKTVYPPPSVIEDKDDLFNDIKDTLI